MSDSGHASVELAVGVAVLLIPVALAVTAFAPWSERRVLAEAAAAEAARSLVVFLDHEVGATIVSDMARSHGAEVRLGWCGAPPTDLSTGQGRCILGRGGIVEASVDVWAPLVSTPWGEVGGLWVRGHHAEPVDLYRSLP